MIKLGLEKAEEPQIKLLTSTGSSKKQESSGKASTSALFTMTKPSTVWITTNCRKLLKRWEYQITLSASWEICMQVKKQQLELDMKQQTGSKSWKQYVKAVYWHPAYLTSMQSTSCEEKEMATHSSTLAWKIPWTEKPAGHGPRGRRELDTTEVTEYAHHAGWMKHKLESRLQGEISVTSDMHMTPPLWQKAKRD